MHKLCKAVQCVFLNFKCAKGCPESIFLVTGFEIYTDSLLCVKYR